MADNNAGKNRSTRGSRQNSSRFVDIAQFVAITGASTEEAQQFLAGSNLEVSPHLYIQPLELMMGYRPPFKPTLPLKNPVEKTPTPKNGLVPAHLPPLPAHLLGTR